MAKELKLRRGNAVEHANFTGAVGEITYNTTHKTAHLHDGISAGGFEVARADFSNISNADFAAKASSAGFNGGSGTGGGGTGGGADANASYLIVGADTWGLSNERRIQTTGGIESSDGGAGGGFTIYAKLANSAAGPPSNLGAANVGTSSYIARADHVHAMPTANDVQAIPNNRVINAGIGISVTSNGLLTANTTVSLAAQLNDLTNVSIANASNNDLLVYNGATSKWQNFSGNTLGRMTVRDEGAVVGSANAITSINFIGNGVVAQADVNDASKINVTVPTIFDQETVEDIVGAMVSGNVENGINVTYNDTLGKLNFDVNDFSITLSGDVQGTVTVTDLGNVTMNTVIGSNAIALGADTTGNYIGTISSANTANGIVVSGGAGEGIDALISLNLIDADFVEGIQDLVGNMVSGNTEDGINVTYNDAAGKLNFDVNDFSITMTGALQGTGTVTNLANVNIPVTLAANAVTMGTHTTGPYVSTVGLASQGNGLTINSTVTQNGNTALLLGLNLNNADFLEGVQDIVATLYDGTHTGINVVYNDAANKITLAVQNGVVDAATLQGLPASSFPRANAAATVTQQWSFNSNVALNATSYDNRLFFLGGSSSTLTIGTASANSVTFKADSTTIFGGDIFRVDTNTPYLHTTNFATHAAVREVIEDYVANLLSAGTHTNIGVTYNDAAATLSLAVLTPGLNADKLDNYDSTDFTRKVESLSVTGAWQFLSNPGDNTAKLKVTDGSSKAIHFLPNTSGAAYNGIVTSGDSVILGTAADVGNGSVVLTTQANATSGVRVTANAVQIEGTSVTIAGNSILTSKSGMQRAITHNSALNPSAITASGSVSGDTAAINGALNGYHVLSMVRPDNVNYQSQLAISDTSPTDIRYRVRQNGSYTDWYPIWTSANDGSGSGLDADLLDGKNSTDFALLTGSTFTGTITSTNNQALRATSATPYVNFLPSDWGGTAAYVQAGVDANGGTTGAYLLNVVPSGKRIGQHVSGTGLITETSASGFNVAIGNITRAGNLVWDSANDGAGSGLDADLLDGLNSTSFARVDAASNVNSAQNGTIMRFDNPTGVTGTGQSSPTTLTAFQPSTSAGDAYMSFLNNNVFGFHFGLDRDTNDLFVGGWSMGATKNRVYHKRNATYLATPIRANQQISGGGTITYDASGYFRWSARFICISQGFGAHFSLSGYFDITMPTAGTLVGVSGAPNRTWSASGVQLSPWEALYYILPIGSGATSLDANFRVSSYGAAHEVPENWVLIAHQNSDENTLYVPGQKTVLRKDETNNIGTRAHGYSWTPDGNNNRSIGSASLRYNTIYATTFNGTATSAQYADLAERYEADTAYQPGTVVVFGGVAEVTASGQIADRRVAGVVSTNPAYMMNSDAGGDDTHPYIALVGRVPCRVVGKISKGDMLTTSSVPGCAQATHNPQLGTIIGKALEDHPEGQQGVIEIAVQRC